VTALDHRLYGWLIESDERRFRRAFDAYFQLAFPAVVRNLSRVSRWDAAPLEELAQDALLRFFERVGRGRREAVESIRVSLPRVVPLGIGPAHDGRVRSWGADVEAFRHAATHFEPPNFGDAIDTAWRSRIRLLAGRIPALQNGGLLLVEEAAGALGWISDAERRNDSADFAQCLVREMVARTDRAAMAERQLPGVTGFVSGIATITAALPQLRVPTNAFLFEIAMSLYLDECKRRARKKRGGAGVSGVAPPNGSSRPEIASEPTVRLSVDATELDVDGGHRFEDASDLTTVGVAPQDLPVQDVDPAVRYEHEQFFEKFYEYLRRPVDEATEAFASADTEAGARAARRSLDSISRKFLRTISVLSLLGEGHTQEQTAKRLGLSRNQVKYIIELVKDAYAAFVANADATLTRPASGGAQRSAS